LTVNVPVSSVLSAVVVGDDDVAFVARAVALAAAVSSSINGILSSIVKVMFWLFPKPEPAIVSWPPSATDDGVSVRVAIPIPFAADEGAVAFPVDDDGGVVAVSFPVIVVDVWLVALVCADANGVVIANDAIAKPATNKEEINNFLSPVRLDITAFLYY
jgi:hypothetical protein